MIRMYKNGSIGEKVRNDIIAFLEKEGVAVWA